jgi:pathogenesis-related protein 1
MKSIFMLCGLLFMLMSISASAIDFNAEEFIQSHNHWRAKVGVNEKLAHSMELQTSAQNWANYLMKNNHCQMKHSEPHGKYGENIYWASALNWSDGHNELQKISPQNVVDSWGSEVAHYNYKSNSCLPGKMCGHYTQMVWRDTKKVGCAVAVCENAQQQIWVCQYQPAGNWIGRFPY